MSFVIDGLSRVSIFVVFQSQNAARFHHVILLRYHAVGHHAIDATATGAFPRSAGATTWVSAGRRRRFPGGGDSRVTGIHGAAGHRIPRQRRRRGDGGGDSGILLTWM